jgi:hypothetical protein
MKIDLKQLVSAGSVNNVVFINNTGTFSTDGNFLYTSASGLTISIDGSSIGNNSTNDTTVALSIGNQTSAGNLTKTALKVRVKGGTGAIASNIVGLDLANTNTSTGAGQSLTGLKLVINNTANGTWAAGKFVAQSISFGLGGTATYTDMYLLRLLRGVATTSFPVTTYGLSIDNLGFGGTNTIGINIALQSGSTNNYAIVSALGNKHGFGTVTPTSQIHIGASSGSASTSPIKFSAGTLLAALELGSLEFTDDGVNGHLYITRNLASVLTRTLII